MIERLYFGGYEFIVSTSCVEKEQRRKHKKKRINKKWQKRYGYKYVPSRQLFLFDNKLIGHPDTIKRVIQNCSTQQEVE